MIQKILTPFQKFVKIESFSGILLFCSALIALIWANSPYGHLYESLWGYKVGINTQDFQLNKPLILWINDGLMAIFFFLIGLEIKRELLLGELNSFKKAAFPLFAAIGGMSVPVIMFMLINQNPETAQGWGIPMATDIAFSLAILKLLGDKVPISLKIFLTAFAIVDDLGAVLVIAIFYSGAIKLQLLAYAGILLAVLFYLGNRQFYSKFTTFGIGAVIWYFFLKAGVHPTIAGVLLAFTIPIRQKIEFGTYTRLLTRIVERIKNSENPGSGILSKEQIAQIDNLQGWTHKVQSPLQYLEHQLHNWVAYFIMPIFALANAGVVFSEDMVLDMGLITTITICLVVGNAIGISFMTWLGVTLKVVALPPEVSKWQILGMAFLAGVGFTMSIFVANLAYADSAMFIDSAKVGIFIGSFISGLIAYMILRFAPAAKA
ncbi:MAG: Na+/H+ antiporter NhaA [Bacteroidota bacterium]